jgi:hypothetical protein
MTREIDDGSNFPDLAKAGLGKTLEDLIKPLVDDDKEFFQLGQTTKERLKRQKQIDLKSFVESQSAAIERGNQNACDSRHKFDLVARDLGTKVTPISVPGTNRKSSLGQGRNKTKLPKTRSSTPTRGDRSRPPSMAQVNLNQSVISGIGNRPHFVQPVETDNSVDKAKRNLDKFTQAHSGQRGSSIGDRAVVFSANGTPHYGDSYLDRNIRENLAANQATANVPTGKIPSRVEVVRPISAAPFQQQPRANITPKSDTVANMAVLGGIAAAVTAVLFFFQYVLMFVQFIMGVSSTTSTITNIASSFTAILNNIGSLVGLGEGVLEPLEKTFDSILNNTFGKDKVDYVKYQFAKISSAFVAAQNLANKVSGLDNTIGKVTEKSANNSAIIGNALKAMQMIGGNIPWMAEDNKVNSKSGKLGAKLESVSGLASSLSEVTQEVKSFKDSQDSLDKEYQERLDEEKKEVDKATDINSDLEVPDANIVAGIRS